MIMISRGKLTCSIIIIIALLITSINAHAQWVTSTGFNFYPSYNSYYSLYGFGNTYLGSGFGIYGGYEGYNWSQPYHVWNIPYNHGWYQPYGWGNSYSGWTQPYANYIYGLPFWGFFKPFTDKFTKPVISRYPPKQPKNLQISHVTDSNVSLIWEDRSDDEDGFRIERKQGAGGAWVELTGGACRMPSECPSGCVCYNNEECLVSADSTTFTDGTVSAGQTYYYRICAYKDDDGNSSYSNESDAVIPGVHIAVRYAFVANYAAGLTILDVSDPENPVFRGSYDSAGNVQNVFVAGSYAYVCTVSQNRIEIIDVSDPANPRLEGYFSMPDLVGGVEVAGNYAYATGYAAGGLQIIDVSNPASPVFRGWYDTPGNAWVELDVLDSYAYVPDSAAGLQIIDVSNPNSPTLTGNYASDQIGKVFIRGDYAYVEEYNRGFRVLDISSPNSPSSVYSYDVGQCQAIDVLGNHAYVPFYNHRLEVFDVTDPLNIKHIKSFYHPYRPCAIDVFEDHAYTGDGYDKRVTVIDVSNPASPTLKASYLTTSWVWRVFVKYCLISSSLNAPSHLLLWPSEDQIVLSWQDNSDNELGFSIERSEDGLAGTYVQIYDTMASDVQTYTDAGLTVDKEYCYRIKSYNAGAESSYSEALCVTTYPDPPKHPKNLQISHVTDNSVSLIWEDRSDDEDGFRIERRQGEGGAWIELTGGACRMPSECPSGCVCCNNEECLVGADGTTFTDSTVSSGQTYCYRVRAYKEGGGNSSYSNESDPVIPGRHQAVRYAFISDRHHGLYVVDINDHTNPHLAGHCSISGQSMGIFVAGNYAYIHNSDIGDLRIIDITDPTAPVSVGTYSTTSYEVNQSKGFDVIGDHVFFPAINEGLKIINVSDKANPTLTGEIIFATVISVDVIDNYAYVAAGGNEAMNYFKILDISDLSNPVIVGGVQLSNRCVNEVFVVGDYCYCSAPYSGFDGYFYVIDVSDTANPSIVGSVEHLPDWNRVMDVVGGYAYVADDNLGELRIIDVRNPLAPAEISHLPISGSQGFGVDIVGDYCYHAASGHGLLIYDISTPTAPSLVNKFDIWDDNDAIGVFVKYCLLPINIKSPKNLQVSNVTSDSVSLIWEDRSDNETQFRIERKTGDSGDWAVIGTVGQNITTYVDIDDAGSPVEYGDLYYYRVSADASDYSNVTEAVAPGKQQAVRHAFVANHEAGLTILDVSDPENPVFKGSYDNEGGVGSVFVAGNYAYACTASPNRLDIVDVSDPAHPRLEGYYSMPDKAGGVEVVGNYAYVTASAAGGLQIIDVSNPAGPVFVGWYDTPGNAWVDIDVLGNYAYLPDSEAGLMIIDVSNPDSPTLIGNYDATYLSHLFIRGSYAYLDEWNNGFHVLDISNPASPSEVYSYDIGQSQGIDVVGNLAYVPFYSHRLEIFDVSNPLSIQHKTSFYHTYRPCSIDVFENYAYTGDGYDNRVTVIDISNPASPTVKASYLTTSWVWRVFVKYCLLYTEGP